MDYAWQMRWECRQNAVPEKICEKIPLLGCRVAVSMDKGLDFGRMTAA